MRPQDEHTLRHTGGLVIACFNMMEPMPLDPGVLEHMRVALDHDKPVFIQEALANVTQAGEDLGFDPERVIVIGNNLKMISERLEGVK